ncbi:molecular chaperone HtpG [Methylobacterium sp. 174MFSha1.1]|uniref:molecular chaperone HtpG n=1 Tax=Methylobacterium sp. 174MFSha1.1 TaxID=1502749 RepID=UPI0008E1F1A6|nr:molecular chaperone HtpG [Methylobacterium sp. 174MFSha1.1]SFU95272.1 molecular chaperone HtpG [Methylobacterium sp. 174MFSha1.1]
MSETVERHSFGAEVGRLLDLVVHALYSEREIFLRELVANAADAVDRRRFGALTDSALALPADAKVRINPDKAARTLTISDPGIGMGKDELAQNLGTIARSGTRAFSQSLADAKPEERPSLIGQFGVGFYSAFMVADRVEVTSRKAGSDEAWTWASEGQGEYTLAPATKPEPGTDIVLHMKADAEEYLEPLRLETIVRKWADHITVPVTLLRDGEEVPGTKGTALWRKPKSEVTEEEYTEFYRQVAHAFDKPWATLHWRAEGQLEFTALLFVPGMKPFMAVEEERESKVRLHVRRMFITDEAGLLPSWLRFVKGVVDTEDLPLNVSREMLQATPVLARIRRAVTGKVLSELKTRAKDAESYATFWQAFGPVLKEGLWEDAEHRQDIASLLRFRSSTVEGWTSLADYVSRMKPNQEAIYILVGDDTEALKRSAQIEGFSARGLEVLLLSDHVDAFWPERMDTFEGKPIRSITQGGDDLSAFEPEVSEGDAPADLADLLPKLKEALKDDVSDVKASQRLVDSAVLLSAPAFGPDLQMQRLLRRAGRGAGGGMGGQPVLELNPRHPLIRRIAERAAAGEDVGEAAQTLVDLAHVQGGDPPRDPVAFARRVASALAQG